MVGKGLWVGCDGAEGKGCAMVVGIRGWGAQWGNLAEGCRLAFAAAVVGGKATCR